VVKLEEEKAALEKAKESWEAERKIVVDEFSSYRRTKFIIKHYEQASFLNMEVGVFHSHAYPFVPVK